MTISTPRRCGRWLGRPRWWPLVGLAGGFVAAVSPRSPSWLSRQGEARCTQSCQGCRDAVRRWEHRCHREPVLVTPSGSRDHAATLRPGDRAISAVVVDDSTSSGPPVVYGLNSWWVVALLGRLPEFGRAMLSVPSRFTFSIYERPSGALGTVTQLPECAAGRCPVRAREDH
jgi:hypothetical protein